MMEIAVGMKVMVTSNIETDLNITNGARGEIMDITLHPDEPTLEDGPVVKLKYLPAYVLVRLTRTRASQLEGLDEGIIPVEVATQNFQIKVREVNRKYVTQSVRHRQYPMTAAYGFTDYHSATLARPNSAVYHSGHCKTTVGWPGPLQPVCGTFSKLRT
jgi:hypothetical protein